MPDQAVATAATPQQIVVFATPSVDHRVALEYLVSLTQTVWMLSDAKIPHAFAVRGGDCFIAKVRNKLVHQFLAEYPMATDLFWIDDDIGWPPGKVIEFLRRPEDIVAGIYPKKQATIDFPVELAVDEKTGALLESNGLVRALAIPMGFTRIKRHVLERMCAATVTFNDSEMDGQVGTYPSLYETGRGPDGFFWGEDYVFSRKATDAGFTMWVDPSIEFAHRGNNKWTATLADHMHTFRRRAAEAVAAHHAQQAHRERGPLVELTDVNGGRVTISEGE